MESCPNCNVELEIKYQSTWDERGPLYKPMKLCGICSFGWFVDWKGDE